MARSSKQVMISLDRDTFGQLDGTVERYGIPRSCVITIALRQYFEREKANVNTN
jgi:metal-responsive CopG/Arc/MetJ family transcriptional regulator